MRVGSSARQPIKAAYVVIGLDLEGIKEVIGIWIGEAESAKFWLSVLSEMKNRGVCDILIASVDNLSGFSGGIAAAFPQTQIRKCIVHQVRNSIRYVSYKDVKKVAAALRRVYTAPILAGLPHRGLGFPRLSLTPSR
jgi:transposase-like protein